jgi:hypothetical protein
MPWLWALRSWLWARDRNASRNLPPCGGSEGEPPAHQARTDSRWTDQRLRTRSLNPQISGADRVLEPNRVSTVWCGRGGSRKAASGATMTLATTWPATPSTTSTRRCLTTTCGQWPAPWPTSRHPQTNYADSTGGCSGWFPVGAGVDVPTEATMSGLAEPGRGSSTPPRK